jgi:hypothetical protein
MPLFSLPRETALHVQERLVLRRRDQQPERENESERKPPAASTAAILPNFAEVKSIGL